MDSHSKCTAYGTLNIQLLSRNSRLIYLPTWILCADKAERRKKTICAIWNICFCVSVRACLHTCAFIHVFISFSEWIKMNIVFPYEKIYVNSKGNSKLFKMHQRNWLRLRPQFKNIIDWVEKLILHSYYLFVYQHLYPVFL